MIHVLSKKNRKAGCSRSPNNQLKIFKSQLDSFNVHPSTASLKKQSRAAYKLSARPEQRLLFLKRCLKDAKLLAVGFECLDVIGNM